MALAEIITKIRNATGLYSIKKTDVADALDYLKTGVESAENAANAAGELANSANEAAGGALSAVANIDTVVQEINGVVGKFVGFFELDNSAVDVVIDFDTHPDLLLLNAADNVNIQFSGAANSRKTLMIVSHGFEIAFQGASFNFGDFGNTTLVEITVIDGVIIINKMPLE